MGRAKIAMEFITKEKARNVTYAKRKKGLLKKGHEFAILCNVPVCIIIFPYSQGTLPLEPEVHAFKGVVDQQGPKELVMNRTKDPDLAREIIERYLGVPVDERVKRAVNLSNMFDEWKRKADLELSKLRHKNAMAKYPNLSNLIDHFTPEQLFQMLVHLDQKLEFVNDRINLLKGDNKSGLVEKPVSNNNANNHHLVEYHNHMETAAFDQHYHVPMYHYSVFNQDYLQDQKVSSMGFDHLGVGSSSSSSGSNAVMYNYNMNIYNDHRLSGVGAAASSYGAGGFNMPVPVPMPMPVPVPMQMPVLSSFPFPDQYMSG